MAAVAGTFETHPQNTRRWWLTYVLLVGIMVGLVLTIRAMGSSTVGTPNPRPQTGPPVTVVAPVTTKTMHQPTDRFSPSDARSSELVA